MKKRGRTILSLFLLLSAGTTCYFLFAGEDPNLAPLKEEIKKIQEQDLSPQQMMTAHRQIREKAKNLSESAKRELRQVGRKGFRKMIKQRVDAYFKAPPEQQTAILDKQIREMEKFRQQMQAMRKQGDRPEGRRGEGGGPGGGRGRWANASQEQRDQRRKDRMEHSDPQDRSRMMEYLSALRDRRKELGMPDMRPPRR